MNKRPLEEPRMRTSRWKMVELIMSELEYVDMKVLAAMRKVPRHLFVEEALAERAYELCTLPIGEGQTISSPLTVAEVSTALKITGAERILEIGTGSGYQAAVISEMGAKVYSVEIHTKLAMRARRALMKAGYSGVGIRIGDGSLGWKQYAPFDRIVVTASPPAPPVYVEKQLQEGGLIVVPVGTSFDDQYLMVGEKVGERVEYRTLGKCHFVRMEGKSGW